MNAHRLCLIVLGVAAVVAPAAGQDSKEKKAPTVYVPYRDVAGLIGPTDRAVLMDRPAFARLLAAAEANARAAETYPAAQVTAATYRGQVRTERLTLSGKLTVVSLSDKPVAVPLGLAQLGLSRITLDGKPAPLGYDKKGRLVLVVTGRGPHALELAGWAELKELRGGGIQFGVSLPTATAGEMTFTAPGDLEVHATVPVSSTKYDKPADRTTVGLTLGGHGSFSVVLMGNGRQEDRRAILLGTSATTVQLTRAYETMHCLYTVQVLRRGVRELTFAVPAGWTVTDVSCPSLVRWSLAAAAKPGEPKRLVVRLRTARRGTKAVHVKATAPRRAGGAWTSPSLKLIGADYQHGYLLVDTGRELAVRGQRLAHARREDIARASFVPGLLAASQGRMFYHWLDDWSVGLDLATVALRTSCEGRHHLRVTHEELALTSQFEVTAIGRELFDLAVELPAGKDRWHLRQVTVDGKKTPFEYHVVAAGGRRTLKIALARPVRAEGVARVTIAMRHVPADWAWPPGTKPREVELPLLRAKADSLSGLVAVAPAGDLDVAATAVPAALKKVTVGRMTPLGLAGDVQLAYTYEADVAEPLKVRVSRRAYRLSAGAVGLVTAHPTKLTGLWRIDFGISRAHARKLYVLADKRLGGRIKITAPGRHLAGRNVVAPGEGTVELAPALAKAYDLWQLTLDSQTLGAVVVRAAYDWPLTGEGVAVPLVRPVGARQISEFLALQASEELDVTATAEAAGDVDAVDLPPLPARARRLLRAFRLESPATPDGARAAVRLATQVHGKYEIPPALAAEASLVTYLGADGSQRTGATFRVVNAGMQFLAVRLPKAAEMWSVRVAGRQAKPKRNAAGDYLVALVRSAKAQEVKVVYASQQPCELSRVALGRASLPGVRVNRLRWTVLPPPGYRICRQFTDMETGDLYRPKLAGTAFLEKLRDLLSSVQVIGTLGSKMMAQHAAERVSRELGEAQYEEETADGIFDMDETTAKAPRDAPAGGEDRRPGRKKEAKPPAKPRFAGTPKAKGKPTPPPATQPAKRERDRWFDEEGVALGRLRARGRYTLPVKLVASPFAGPRARFAALGEADLEVGLSHRTTMDTAEYLGLATALLAGLVLVGRSIAARAAFVVAVLAASTLVAIWSPGAAHLANGAFLAALCLIPLYPAVAIGRWLWRKIAGVAASPSAAAAAVLVAGAVMLAAAPAAAGKAAKAPPARAAAPRPAGPPPIVVPYEGDPTAAEKANKVLVPYRRFVELWNRAHPDEKIDEPRGPVEVSLADVRYTATLAGERMNVVLTARLMTLGGGWTTLPVPMSGLAVTDATFDGKPANLQVGPKGMILTLPGNRSGVLRVSAVTTPKALGRRGSVKLSLPPLPGAVMTVALPADDLVLEAPGVPGGCVRAAAGAPRWTVPLGLTRELTLKWSPKVGLGAADRTLSAAAAHDVHAFHWAVVGVSKVIYRFSAGRNDRFALLLPADATLTDLTGANLRDFRVTGRRTVGGVALSVVEVRLHRPATKQYELTARWVGKLPALDKPARLALPRAAGVGRESGTVTLHAADGMTVKVLDVAGGRRSATAGAKADPKRPSVPVARYYWPYRPFAMTVQLARQAAEPVARVDQLVRISRRQVELLAEARLTAKRGRLFGASFVLPDGYELLSAVGPAVEDHYEQPTPAGRRLHVNFRSGVAATKVALVLVRKDIKLGRLPVPTVTAIDPEGHVLGDQTGRLAVQVAASLDAESLASENLRSIPPRQITDWLSRGQVNAVQFAYRYERPKFSLDLKVSPQKTKVRVDIFGGLTVRATSAWYSYRLRYRIEGTPIDEVRFTLPDRYAAKVAVNSPTMRSVTKAPAPGRPGRTEWTVALVNEVTGTLDVAVNFAETVDAATSALDIPRIETTAPEGYRAILAVQNASRHELRLAESKRLTPLAASEQRKLLSEPVRKSLQFVLQSFTPDFSAILAVKLAKPARRIEAIVDLLALETVVDRAGRCRYLATLAIQNRTRQFLQVRLPAELKLWSAIVAGQPVKPVHDAKAAGDLVLIPLVKTSPGGLPYEVKLYLAGPAAERLGLVTELKPPAVRIEGVPVERTTWSLRLPAGFRYVRPGGNLSPVAAAIESKIVAIEAKLSQLRRFQDSFGELVSLGSYRGQTVARKNWKALNKELSYEIAQAQEDIETNRGELSKGDYSRLQRKLTDQSSSQYGYNVTWDRNEAALKQADAGINVFLNNDVTNPGIIEGTRNAPMNSMPSFLRKAAEGQKAQITADIASNAAVIDAQKTGQVTIVNGTVSLSGKVIALDGGTIQAGGQQILVEDDEAKKHAQVAEVLGKLQIEQQRRQEGRQKELKSQLGLLADNRLLRHYVRQQQAGQGQQGAQPAMPGQAGAGSSLALRSPDRSRPTTADLFSNRPRADGRGATGGGRQVWGDNSARGRVARAGDLSVAAGKDASVFEVNGDVGGAINLGGSIFADKAGGAALGTGLAVARGTFSLPIALPAGGVRRDFQGPYHPQDGPTVSILAVDERLIDGAYSTGGVFVGVLILYLLSLLIRQIRLPAAAAPTGYVPAYVLLAAILAGFVLLGGMTVGSAVLAFAAIACPIEIIHRLLARRAAAARA